MILKFIKKIMSKKMMSNTDDIKLKLYGLEQQIVDLEKELIDMNEELSKLKYDIVIDIPIKQLIKYYKTLPRLKPACRLRNIDDLDFETTEEYKFPLANNNIFRLLVDYKTVKMNFNIQYIMGTLKRHAELRDDIIFKDKLLLNLYNEKEILLNKL